MPFPQRLLERGYFDTLRLRPNLATLLIRDYAMQGGSPNGRRKARVVDLLNVGSGFRTGRPRDQDRYQPTLWASPRTELV
ncbi:MAG: hypothetical protein IPK76_10025 [Lewinellaceae bacterium]|nr:hypothetical protein [Lewinellaceae bacterium]